MRWTKGSKWYSLFDAEWDRRMSRLAAIIVDDSTADEIEEIADVEGEDDDDEVDQGEGKGQGQGQEQEQEQGQEVVDEQVEEKEVEEVLKDLD